MKMRTWHHHFSSRILFAFPNQNKQLYTVSTSSEKKKRYHQTVYLWNFFPFWGADLHISQLKLRDHQLGTKRPTPEGGIHRTPIQAGQMKMALSSMSRMRSVHLRLAESAIRKYFGLADFSNSPGYQVYPSIRISDRVFKHLSHF